MNIDKIEACINWFDSNSRSTNLTDISLTINKMSTECYYFSKLVADAYELQSNAEDSYKTAKAKFIKECTEGITKATAILEADETVRKAKKEYTDANNTFFRLRQYANQFETILECKRQFVSVEKALNAKGI